MVWWKRKLDTPPTQIWGPSESEAIQRAIANTNSHKAMLYDAWKALAQQQKGMRRMARKIKRLHREIADLKRQTGG